MVASIRAHGLLQNLVVSKGGRGYPVEDGERRRLALNVIMAEAAGDETKFPPGLTFRDGDPLVPCEVREQAQAEELSLAANFEREPMHPADEFEAFAKLAGEEGASVGDIAARFGVKPLYVEQRMRLGRLSPKVLKLYRAGKIGGEEAVALTLISDHKEQEKVAGNGHVGAWQIRSHVAGRKVPVSMALFPVEAYTAAGGTITKDLFADPEAKDQRQPLAWFDDIRLFAKLQREHLQVKADAYKAAGWSRVEIVEIEGGHVPRYFELPRGWDRIHPGSKGFTAAHRKRGTVLIRTARNGEVRIDEGLVHADQVKAEKAAEREKTRKAKVKAGEPAPAAETRDYSVALQRDLGKLKHRFIVRAIDDAGGLVTDVLRLLGAENVLRIVERWSRDRANEELATLLNLDIAVYWRPDEEFWGRLSKPQILAAVEETCGQVVAKRFENLKKGELVKKVAPWFVPRDGDKPLRESDFGYTSEAQIDVEWLHKLYGWLPTELRFRWQTGEPMPEGDDGVAAEISDDIENAEGQDDVE